MFCHYRRSAPATKPRDKMCLWSTAGTPNPPGQAPPDTREIATLLLSICYHIGPMDCRLPPSCYSFAIELLPLPFCAPSPRHVSDVYIAAPQGCPFRIPVITERYPPALNSPPCARAIPCLTAWPTPHDRTVNCAPVRRYRGS